MKEWRHRSAHGNYVRVRWTPDGLEVDHGQGFGVAPGPTSFSAEYCGMQCQCPQARFLKPAPSWWESERMPDPMCRYCTAGERHPDGHWCSERTKADLEAAGG